MGILVHRKLLPSLGRVQLSLLLLCLLGLGQADFSDQCPQGCTCKWANGKREADCQSAGLEAVPETLHHEIQILRMGGNRVQRLGKEVFKRAGLLNLQRIYMNNCHVQEVHVEAFRDLKIMVELDLSNNNITEIVQDTFKGNERLQTLTVSHNQISELHPYQFPPLEHLKSIDFSHNYISVIDRKTFSNLGNSVEGINLNHNLLRGLREGMFHPLMNLKSLSLHSNPWACDCRLRTFRDWVVASGLYTYPTVCSEPERLAGRQWDDVEKTDFACKPEIRVPQSVVFSQPGANVTLSCFIVGSPIPDAKWVLKGRIVNNNTIPVGGDGSQHFYIQEEGGLERWFNLTITNVGLESVADYTCVAVNAGGVMEENISLTFEEPEPVGLPGGKKEESRLAVMIGAAAAGFFFVMLSLLLLCCCCCRRRIKQHSSTPSSASSRTPERHGSVIGFADSNSSQRLIQQGYSSQKQLPDFNATVTAATVPTAATTSPTKPSQHFQGIPLQAHELAEAAAIQVEMRDLQQQQQQRPKALVMVTSNGVDGGHFHSVAAAETARYPDLIQQQQHHPQQQQQRFHPSPSNSSSSSSTVTATAASCKPSQPLNPAALVVPPAPPPAFPHQFPHLIHSSRHHSTTLPSHVQRQHQQRQSPGSSSSSMTPVLLSPPAQFGQEHQGIPTSSDSATSYVTLPRQYSNHHQRPLQPRGSGQHVDWASLYDGVGPRTSAAGASATTTSSSPPPPPPPLTQAQLRTIPEEPPSSSSTRSTSSPHLSSTRNSSESEASSSMGGYGEPFGRAVLPPPSQRPKNRDSFASSAGSEMDGMLSSGGVSGKECPLHAVTIKVGSSMPAEGATRQLKGILKGGTTNKTTLLNPKAAVAATPAAVAAFHPSKNTVNKALSGHKQASSSGKPTTTSPSSMTSTTTTTLSTGMSDKSLLEALNV